ncbi:uncharacterized protein IL334_005102 [Kwoniella shivajii]|uniref:Zn(2)-C6 fungal-type domain-containing protein n=1 Tax=Kwoniella shivajii TaxID=564305 RepID=A0ABZ1D655_9TREE|nr:hypothetical protein IL334_005102 [Kwoniella shivajii]
MPSSNYPPIQNGNTGYQPNPNYPPEPYPINSRPGVPNQQYLPPPYVLPQPGYQQPQGQYPQQPQYALQPLQNTPAEKNNASSQAGKGIEESNNAPSGIVVPAKRGRPKKNANVTTNTNGNSTEKVNKKDPNHQSTAKMVYPPPPPPPGERYKPTPLFTSNNNYNSGNSTPSSGDPKTRDGVQLPSMGSWAPPSVASPRTAAAMIGYQNQHQAPFDTPDGWSSVQPRPGPNAQPQWNLQPSSSYDSSQSFPSSRPVKRERDSAQDTNRPLSDPGEMEASLALAGLKRRDSAPTSKKPKKEREDSKSNITKKSDKDGKKSCAECRRLKAKCDRQFPCSNCRRRGCALVCPDGDLSCMQGKRLVLASTEQLHERIAQLESALFKSHGKTHPTHHPLLAPEYLDGGFASLPPPPPLQQSPPSGNQSHSPKSGSLNRSPKGPSSASSLILATPQLSAERSSNQGRMAVESLLTEDAAAPEGKREDEWAGENAAPAMIIGTVGNQPNDDLDERHQVFERLKKILKVLPPREEVQRRAENFWRTSVWYQTALHKEEFDAIYEPAVFAPTPANPLSPHKLAVVLIVLTLDCYLDISNDEENPAVAEYWDACQRCFDTRFGWAASVAGVQALAMATLFVGFGWRGARASNFYWLRQMTSASMQLGLHKDPHPSLPEEEREFRRRVFHEIFVLDCLICLNHGQRTAIPVEYIEAAYPKTVSPLAYKKYDFMKAVKTQVIDIGCLPDSLPANWEKVEVVKQALMLYDVTAIPQLHCPLLRGEPLPSPVEGFTAEDALALQSTTTSMCHYKAMLYLFRPSLRRLVARLRSQPRESVIFNDADRETVSMTYRACHAITLTSYYMARKHPRLMARCWMVWVQTFSAAVSMAALAIWCGPHVESTFVNSAYQELSEACDMIGENGSKRSLGVLSLLPILKSLVANRYPHVSGKNPSEISISADGEDMLFALLGGQVDVSRDPCLTNAHANVPPNTAQPSSGPQQMMQQQQHQHQQHQQQQVQQQILISQQGIKPSTYLGIDQGQGQEIDLSSFGAGSLMIPEIYSEVAFSGQNPNSSTASWYAQQQMMAGEIILPLVQSAPSAVPFNTNGSGNNPNNNNNNNNDPNSNGNGSGNGNELENPTELWARLQTFYEPTPVFWNGMNTVTIDGITVGMNNNINNGNGNGPNGTAGFVDYSGPMY